MCAVRPQLRVFVAEGPKTTPIHIRLDPREEILDARGDYRVLPIQDRIRDHLQDIKRTQELWTEELRSTGAPPDPPQLTQPPPSESLAWSGKLPYPVSFPRIQGPPPNEVRILRATHGRLRNPEIPLTPGVLNQSVLRRNLRFLRCIPWNPELEALQENLLREQPPQVRVKIDLPKAVRRESQGSTVETRMEAIDEELEVSTEPTAGPADGGRQLVWLAQYETEIDLRQGGRRNITAGGGVLPRPIPVILEPGMTVGQLKAHLVEQYGKGKRSDLAISAVYFHLDSAAVRKLSELSDGQLVVPWML